MIFSRSTAFSFLVVWLARACVIFGGRFTISVKASSLFLIVGCGSMGHSSSVHFRNCGPVHQVSLFASSSP